MLQRRLKVHFGDGQALANLIVQFAGNVPPLGFLDLDQAMGNDLEFLAGAFAREFALFERLGHEVKGPSQAP